MTQQLDKVDAADVDAMLTMQQMSNNHQDHGMTPWSWTTDEANQYLFSQIENDFAFGEGGMLQWSPSDLMNNALTPNFSFTDQHPSENGASLGP
jgi:hypothetical protein